MTFNQLMAAIRANQLVALPAKYLSIGREVDNSLNTIDNRPDQIHVVYVNSVTDVSASSVTHTCLFWFVQQDDIGSDQTAKESLVGTEWGNAVVFFERFQNDYDNIEIQGLVIEPSYHEFMGTYTGVACTVNFIGKIPC